MLHTESIAAMRRHQRGRDRHAQGRQPPGASGGHYEFVCTQGDAERAHQHVVGEPDGALEQRHGLLHREVVEPPVQAPVREQVLERLLALRAGWALPVRRPPEDAVHCGASA